MPGASELARVGQGLPYEASSKAQRFPGTNHYPSDSEAVKVGHPAYVMPASGVGNKGCAIWLLPLQEHCRLMSALAGKVSDRYTGREIQRSGSGRLGSSSMADPVLYSRLWERRCSSLTAVFGSGSSGCQTEEVSYKAIPYLYLTFRDSLYFLRQT